MEYSDILTPDGKLTGEKRPRDAAHKDGDWHQSVHVWIINSKGELLIQKRSPNKPNSPNLWDISVGGHILAGDKPIDSALKEIKEEIGLEVGEKDLKYLFSVKRSSIQNQGKYFNNEFEQVFLLKKDLDLAKINFQKEEITELKFIPWQELKKKIESKDPHFARHIGQYKKFFEYLKNSTRQNSQN